VTTVRIPGGSWYERPPGTVEHPTWTLVPGYGYCRDLPTPRPPRDLRRERR
jgi:hypothetical protein